MFPPMMMRVLGHVIVVCLLGGCMSLPPSQTEVITRAEALSSPLTRTEVLRSFGLDDDSVQSTILSRCSATCVETWDHHSGLKIRASKVVWRDSTQADRPSTTTVASSPRRSASLWFSEDALKKAERSFPIATFDTVEILRGDMILYPRPKTEGLAQ